MYKCIKHSFGAVLEQVYLLQPSYYLLLVLLLSPLRCLREIVMVYLDVTVQLGGKGLFLHESVLIGGRVDGHFWRELIGILLYLHRLFGTAMTILLIHQYWIITTQPYLAMLCLDLYCLWRKLNLALICTLTLTCSKSPMRREGGTTLTSLTRVSAIARRRFSLLLPFG